MPDSKVYIGSYEILGLLGKGGMGSVYLGQETTSQQKVAIKLLAPDAIGRDQELLERLKREGDALRLLDHPNIVKILNVLQEHGHYSLVLEYVEGGSLYDLLKKQGQLPLTAILKIALELADALTRAHHLKIIHRDIKPANIMFARDGTLRLTDFGLARMERGQTLTQSGMMMGSLAYISPEAIEGKSPDARIDIWAFGVMLYEMLTGRQPFEGSNMASTLTAILMQDAPTPMKFRPDTPPRLANLVLSMLVKDPKERIASIRKVAAELEQIAEEMGVGNNLVLPEDIKTRINEPRPVEPIAVLPSFATSPTLEMKTVAPPAVPRRSNGLLMGMLLVLLVIVGVLALQFVGNDGQTESTSQKEKTVVLVEPVAGGELMILVAQAQPLSQTRPQIDRFIRENLQETLDLNATLTGLRVREYPDVVESQEEAEAIARANNAPMIIWGTYDEAFIDLNIEVFTYAENTPLAPSLLSDTGNVRVRLTDERTQSIAPQVLTSATIWYVYHSQPYEAAATMVVYDELEVDPAETVGRTVGANVHWHYENLYDDPAAAVEYLDAALRSDPENPIVYHLRGAAIDRLGKTSEALQNVDTALLLSNNQWDIPYLNRANLLSSNGDITGAIAHLDKARALQPDEWLYPAISGSYSYLDSDFDNARTDLEAAIALDPKANFPYALLMNLEIQAGNIAEVQSLLTLILQKFPDPSYGNRIILTAGNQPDYGGYYGLTLSAFNHLVLRQYDASLRDIQAALEIRPESPDLYLFEGVIYCSLGDLESAEQAYTDGLDLNEDMTVLYLLRADVRNRLKKTADALQDFAAARETSAWENFEPVVMEAMAGGAGLGCESFFEPTN